MSGGAPFEHTSVLKMIEWRWNLAPLTARDAHARNLAEMLDFSLHRTDTPAIPTALYPAPVACGAGSAPAHRPQAIPAGGGSTSPPPSGGPPSGGGPPAGAPASGAKGAGATLPATGTPTGLAVVGGVALAAGLAARRVAAGTTDRDPETEPG